MGEEQAYNDFSIDDVFTLWAKLVDVVGCDAHDDDRAGPLHEAGEEQDRAEASTEVGCHCVV